jgi:PEP-CTERM motif-containing protein
MRKSWGSFFRRVATVCLVGGATAWSSALCYAQIAADSATNAPYDDGWQAGDNGGFGWGAWDFTGTYNTPVGQTMDIFSHPNDLGRAWTLFNADAPPGPGTGTDIASAGRRILGNLQPGQTVTVVIDNPTERRFFRGYTVRFNTGGGNTVYAGVPQSRMAIGTFEYFTNGKWFATGTGGNPTLFDTDTDHGMRIDFSLTGVDTFNLLMTPLNDPANAYFKSGTLAGPAGGAIDWVEFEIYNTDSDYYPTHTITGGDTDFYISYMQMEGGVVVPEPSSAALMLLGCGGALLAARARRRNE